MRVRNAGAWRDVTGGRVRIGNVWRNLTGVRAFIGGAWRDLATFTQPLTLSISPSGVTETIVIPGSFTSGTVTATPSGGVGPYAYSWTRISGDTEFFISSTNTAATTFARDVTAEGSFTATYRCTCTDALGSTAPADINIQAIGLDFSS